MFTWKSATSFDHTTFDRLVDRWIEERGQCEESVDYVYTREVGWFFDEAGNPRVWTCFWTERGCVELYKKIECDPTVIPEFVQSVLSIAKEKEYHLVLFPEVLRNHRNTGETPCGVLRNHPSTEEAVWNYLRTTYRFCGFTDTPYGIKPYVFLPTLREASGVEVELSFSTSSCGAELYSHKTRGFIVEEDVKFPMSPSGSAMSGRSVKRRSCKSYVLYLEEPLMKVHVRKLELYSGICDVYYKVRMNGTWLTEDTFDFAYRANKCPWWFCKDSDASHVQYTHSPIDDGATFVYVDRIHFPCDPLSNPHSLPFLWFQDRAAQDYARMAEKIAHLPEGCFYRNVRRWKEKRFSLAKLQVLAPPAAAPPAVPPSIPVRRVAPAPFEGPELGYLYLIRLREFWRMKESIYKIGRTAQPPHHRFRRLEQYPKGSEVVLVIQVPRERVEELENDLKKKFREKFTPHPEGTEYFVGDPEEMALEMCSLVLRKSPQLARHFEDSSGVFIARDIPVRREGLS